jgi:hypothetical protein
MLRRLGSLKPRTAVSNPELELRELLEQYTDRGRNFGGDAHPHREGEVTRGARLAVITAEHLLPH